MVRSAIRLLYGLSMLVLTLVYVRLVLFSLDPHADSEQMFWRVLPDLVVLCLALLAGEATIFCGIVKREDYPFSRLLLPYIAGAALGFVSMLGAVNYSGSDFLRGEDPGSAVFWVMVIWFFNPWPPAGAIQSETTKLISVLRPVSLGAILAFFFLLILVENSLARTIALIVAATLSLPMLIMFLRELFEDGWEGALKRLPGGKPLPDALMSLPVAVVLVWAWASGGLTNYPQFMAFMTAFLFLWLRLLLLKIRRPAACIGGDC